ncbi:hypothetical protein [Saccharopolyspora elongata]|uniref:Uncharacterized protein n=1 Tax=Saccharopolyspora elongata TaxID=2530387 RepID=A0A4R4Y2T0_9PSEU|nr:hypothetical protein [Saccharopolyspora elongata]TDD37784.1 hypothetical protein E1288_39975 [Saccharopolyspora elongata]
MPTPDGRDQLNTLWGALLTDAGVDPITATAATPEPAAANDADGDQEVLRGYLRGAPEHDPVAAILAGEADLHDDLEADLHDDLDADLDDGLSY